MNTPQPLKTIMSSSLIFNAFLACAQPLSTEDAPVPDPTYQLVWQDEFEEDGKPNPNHWNYEEGFARNEEAQWYQADNAVCRDGFLVIEARKERRPNPWYEEESNNWKKSREFMEYTSSSLLTKGLHHWQYGRFEMRAKINTSPGMWPAFWTLGTAGNWPACGEIDIMEYYRGMILANAAWAGSGEKTTWDDFRKEVASFGDPNWADEFHIWRMDWDESTIKLYVDDVLLNAVAVEETINQRGDIENPMKQPHYLIVNLAVGGTNGGDPSLTEFPRKYIINYVRVYQR